MASTNFATSAPPAHDGTAPEHDAPQTGGPGRWSALRWQSDWVVPALGLALAMIIWAAIALVIHDDFASHSESTLRETRNFTKTLEAQLAARLDAIDSTLRFAQNLYAQDPANFTIGPWSDIGRDPDRVGVFFIGTDGFARMGADGRLPNPIDMRDRRTVAGQLADPATDRLLIGVPNVDLVTGGPIIAFTRPLRDAAGRLGGVIFISVATDSFARLFRALDLPDAAVTLFGLDRIVRARVPASPAFLGAQVPDRLVAQIRDGATEVTARGTSPFDGVERLISQHRVGAYPLIVSVSFSVDDAMADPWAIATRLVVMGALLTTLIAAFCIGNIYSRRAGRNAHAALEGAFSHVGHGIMLIGRDLRVLIANRRVSEMLDIPPDLVSPGCPLADIVAWQVQAGEFGDGPVPSANRQSLAPAAAAAIHVYDRVRPNGVILRIRTDPLPDGGYVRSFTDVTESSRAAAAIAAARDAAEAAQAALAAALLNVQHGVMLTGADNRLLLINARAIDLLGLPLELSTPGTKGEDILRFQIARGDLGDVEQTTLAALASFEQQRSVSDHAVPVEVYQRTTYDGRFVEIRVTLLPDQRTLRTYTDITAHRTALRAEADARRAAEAALRSRTEFLAVVSHELRTPLNGIIGINGLLLSASPTPAQVSDLRLVEEAGKQLLAIVDDILRVTQLERGRLVLHEQRFDPRALLRGTAALMLPRAEAKGLHLDLRIDAALPLYVIGDEERLRETLLKLLGNAVKFTETGSITVSADIIAQDTAGCRIAISVADTGIGMLPETMARLFQPFVQADSSNQRRFGGLGLAWRSAA